MRKRESDRGEGGGVFRSEMNRSKTSRSLAEYGKRLLEQIAAVNLNGLFNISYIE